MKATIAVSGKGGTGKTTISAIIIRELIARSAKAVLAVDADPNACLALTLGVDTYGTVSSLREDAKTKDPTNAGIDRLTSFEYGLQQVLTEAKGFDLVTMGQPEGPSCYCAANNLLRKYLDKLCDQYDFVVLDNEAGMEHLSRRTTNNIDLLLIIAEPTPIGQVTAKRIYGLTRSLPITIKQTGVIWNKAETTIDVDGIKNFGSVPFDQNLVDMMMQSKSVLDIAADSPAIAAVRQILNMTLTE
ncbi:MAG: AAA family ATPase [Anaerohalosphaera sp.]|nr:AAA family ATPase [Anaerohalosphaera sp.]